MPRPRTHAPEAVLDAAEELLVEHGRAGLTVRALSGRAGVSNGSIYHAFGTVEDVVASAWLRRAEEFLDLQRDGVDEGLARGDARAAVQAAADAPARLAEGNLRAARLLVALDRDELLTDAVSGPVADRLRALDAALLYTLRVLARAARGRADAAAVDVITTCVVHLPTALLFPKIRAGGVPPLTRAQLAAAVGAVLDCG
jgi:AcrR family transcriptional regulator